MTSSVAAHHHNSMSAPKYLSEDVWCTTMKALHIFVGVGMYHVLGWIVGRRRSCVTAFSTLKEYRTAICRRRRRLPSSPLRASSSPYDRETPEQRRMRMEQVRQIQAAFYKTPSSSSTVSTEQQPTWSVIDDQEDPSLMHNVPLWRVQWVEFPGYQNVLNVHVPHYTHMFRQLLYQNPRQFWYFGHVYLPGGSDNLSNPSYALPTTTTSTLEHEDTTTSSVATIGTLMRITDYRDNREDGRLTLIVQACARLQVLQATQQVPYAVADTVRILDNWEASKYIHFPDTDALEAQSSIKRAHAVAAVVQGRLLTDLEFRSTQFTAAAPADLDQDDGPSTTTTAVPNPVEISPLCNFNKSVVVDWDDINEQVQQVLDEQLVGVGVTTTTAFHDNSSLVDIELLQLEQQVWIQLDVLLKLLETIQPNNVRIPVPTQILGLLSTHPKNGWPTGFRLRRYAEQLEQNNAMVGTTTKTPFVRLVQQYPQYPIQRRCSRLSYVIWLLIGGISLGTQPMLDRQQYLETHSIRRRLQITLDHVVGINTLLQHIIEEERE